MLIFTGASRVEVWTPAKLNLFLEVLARRPDGFHEIETLMCPVNLYDTLQLESITSGQIELTCEGLGAEAGPEAPPGDFLPEDSDNLVVRAVLELRRRAGLSAGAKIRLVKRIPLSAGLAGGSSDAAAALVAANRAWNAGYSRAQLQAMAAVLGSDVPFFLGRGAAVCRGRGERIEPLAISGPLYFVVARPPVGLATAAVYRACQPALAPRQVGPLVGGLEHGRLNQIGRALHNRLQPAAESLSPWIARLKAEFARLDFLGHQMSGSGASYFGLCRHAHHARRMAQLLAMRGVGRVYAVRSCHGFCSN